MVKRFFFIVSFCCLLYGCNLQVSQTENVQLKFLDEYIIPNDLVVDSTLVGGLSGIDYYNGMYYIVCDQDSNARFYLADIKIADAKFITVSIDSAIAVSATNKTLDLESIVVDVSSNDILLVSEGDIKNGRDPSFIKVNSKGELLYDYEIPQYFKAQGSQEPRHNGVFEGLTSSFDNEGYWIATELPLKEDGPKPKFTETTSPVRFTYFDRNGEAIKQFAYLLDRIEKKPSDGEFGINGVTDVLAYAENKLLVIERSYSSGYKNEGNTIKIYNVDYTDVVNTITSEKLTKDNYDPVKKELVFNFESIRHELTNKNVDNIEGITFGPKLMNGNRSLILVSDNNFNTMGQQLNQFILMELINIVAE